MTHFDRCRKARITLNLTQSEVANATGMSQKEISRIESGKRAEIPYRYIQFLYEQGIDLNWLFSGNGSPRRAVDAAPVMQVADPPAYYLSKIKDLEVRNQALLDAIRQLGTAIPGHSRSAHVDKPKRREK